MRKHVFRYYLFKEFKALKFEAEYADSSDEPSKILNKKLNNFNWQYANDFIRSWNIRIKTYQIRKMLMYRATNPDFDLDIWSTL